jgi:DivIVA domain-containing protein
MYSEVHPAAQLCKAEHGAMYVIDKHQYRWNRYTRRNSTKGEAMSLTPADVRAVAFNRAAIGRRGYHEDEVDSFLELVEEELDRLIKQVQPPTAQPEDTPVQPAEVQPAGEAAGHTNDSLQAIRLLQAAEETATRLTKETKTESERLLTDARNQSATLIAEATNRAAAIEQHARTTALTLEKEAQTNHDAILGGLVQKRATLEQEVDELYSYRQEIHRQLRELIRKHLTILEQDDIHQQLGDTPPEDNSAGQAAA